jgi:hypothetical protein
LSKTRATPKQTKSKSAGIKPFLESAKTAFPNVMRRVTQTAKSWAVTQKHSENLKPYLSPGANYPGFDDTWPTPFSLEMPNIPGGGWTDVEYGGIDQYRFLCNISCFQTTKEDDKCTGSIKCTYGAWTATADGSVDSWSVFDSDGNDITDEFIIEWKPSVGLNGQIWITPDPSLASILNDKFETLKFVFRDKGNAAGAYYHPILQRWIQLVAGKSICDDTTRLKCDEAGCTCPSGDFAYDDASTPDTIAPGGTISLFVSGGCPPYSWSVQTCCGYTLGSAITQGLSNTLTSASGTCGVHYGVAPQITITDACSDSVVFQIRNTGGHWGAQFVNIARCRVASVDCQSCFVFVCVPTTQTNCAANGPVTDIVNNQRWITDWKCICDTVVGNAAWCVGGVDRDNDANYVPPSYPTLASSQQGDPEECDDGGNHGECIGDTSSHWHWIC